MSNSVLTRPPAVEQRSEAPRPSSRGSDANVSRWMWTWITIGILVVLVVIAFLIAISNALSSIDDNLFEASAAVSGAGSDVDPLPSQVEMVNTTLTGIDTELAGVPGQADAIIAGLTSIRDRLSQVDGSLANTSGVLGTTSNSLVSTSGVLADVRELAAAIEATLESAESPADNLGASDIFERVAVANGVLQTAKGDTGNILARLVEVNGHLQSICEGLPTPGGC